MDRRVDSGEPSGALEQSMITLTEAKDLSEASIDDQIVHIANQGSKVVRFPKSDGDNHYLFQYVAGTGEGGQNSASH